MILILIDMNMGGGVDGLFNEEILEACNHARLKNEHRNSKCNPQHRDNRLPLTTSKMSINDL